MWTDTKVSSAMGLHAIATKRKHELGLSNEDSDIYMNCPPNKSSRWSSETISTTQTTTTTIAATTANSLQTTTGEDSIAKLEVVAAVSCEPWSTEPIVDSISKLQAVTVPGDTWGGVTTRSTLATALLSTDEFDDDEDDFEDEFEEDESIIPTYCPLRYPCAPQRNYMHQGGYTKPNFYSEPFPQQNCSRTANQQQTQMRVGGNFSWNSQNGNNYYVPQEPPYSQQTIRCAENGKSYLELGSSSFNSGVDVRHSRGCCDGRGTWCNNKSCYKEVRLKIRNLSMFKLSRFRQVSEQSLYRSVLICNTLKHIDKEMESESKDSCTTPSQTFTTPQVSARLSVDTTTAPENLNQGFQQHSQFNNSNNSNDSRDFTPPFNQPNVRLPTLTFNSLCSNDPLHPYDHHPFRETPSGRATPFPSQTHTDNDSGYGDEDGTRSINWSSVLSLSSQSALDPLNNNDLFSTLPATSISTLTTTNVSGSFSTTPTSVTQITTSTPGWEYDLFDMDLGIRPEFTELLPSCKMSSEDLLKSVSPSLSPSRYVHETELEAPAHIMVGS